MLSLMTDGMSYREILRFIIRDIFIKMMNVSIPRTTTYLYNEITTVSTLPWGISVRRIKVLHRSSMTSSGLCPTHYQVVMLISPPQLPQCDCPSAARIVGSMTPPCEQRYEMSTLVAHVEQMKTGASSTVALSTAPGRSSSRLQPGHL